MRAKKLIALLSAGALGIGIAAAVAPQAQAQAPYQGQAQVRLADWHNGNWQSWHGRWRRWNGGRWEYRDQSPFIHVFIGRNDNWRHRQWERRQAFLRHQRWEREHHDWH